MNSKNSKFQSLNHTLISRNKIAYLLQEANKPKLNYELSQIEEINYSEISLKFELYQELELKKFQSLDSYMELFTDFPKKLETQVQKYKKTI